MGLDVVPSVVVGSARDHISDVEDSISEPSLDVFYNFTPSLTGVLTLNTDFSATEVDDRQVNLTRFSTFFPEKRPFFNEGLDIFRFPLNGGSEQLFYTRRKEVRAGGLALLVLYLSLGVHKFRDAARRHFF